MSEARSTEEPAVSVAEFDAFVASQRENRLWELVGGRIVAMTNPSERHAQLVANLGVALRRDLPPGPCRVYFGELRIQRSDDASAIHKPRPDLLVRCGPMTPKNYVTDPVLVAEVLSPSTRDRDRGEKLRFYQRLPTMTHIVLVYQDERRIEHYRRDGEGWSFEALTRDTDVVGLDHLGASVALADVYEGVEAGK